MKTMTVADLMRWLEMNVSAPERTTVEAVLYLEEGGEPFGTALFERLEYEPTGDQVEIHAIMREDD